MYKLFGFKFIYSVIAQLFALLIISNCFAVAASPGKHLIVGFYGTSLQDAEVIQARRLLEQNKIRGVILFSHNIVSPQQLKNLTNYLLDSKHKRGLNDIIISIDQEGGKVARLKKQDSFDIETPSASSYKSLYSVYKNYYNIGKVLREYGINMNFAPVLDVDEHNISPAIGKLGRSFSGNAKKVAEYGRMSLKALNAAGVMPCGKHFPGHGSAITDTHHSFADITNSWKEDVDLFPFVKLQKQLPCIMVGHLFNSNIDSKKPASLSKKYYNLLTDYKGIYVTDDYFMAAIAERYSEQEFFVESIRAGANLVIFGRHPVMMKLLKKTPIALEEFIASLLSGLPERLYSQ